MDPVTAFGLAAGVLQVVDLSLKALSTCKEIYADGSLARNRETEELTKYLGGCSLAGHQSINGWLNLMLYISRND